MHCGYVFNNKKNYKIDARIFMSLIINHRIAFLPFSLLAFILEYNILNI